MKKTIVIILNHNLPELTDNLFESLDKYQGDEYDLVVMDNGSNKDLKSKYTTIHLKKNYFWGGALNVAYKYLLERPVYDSLLFLNNDIELNSEIFVKTLRKELFNNNLAIVSPCISGKPNPWKQMQNWGCKSTRVVKWIDNQAPLFHRKIIESIKQFDETLIYGWGQELVCYEVCKKYNWNIGVCDFLSIVHYGQQTFQQKRLFSLNTVPGQNIKSNPYKKEIDYQSFAESARSSWIDYFKDDEDKFIKLVQYGSNYNSKDIKTIKGKKNDIRKDTG